MGISKIVTMLLLCSGCTPAKKQTTESTTKPNSAFICEIGFSKDDEYITATDASPAELILGFQGFLFVEVRIRAEESSPSPVLVRMSMEVDGSEPFDGSQPDVDLETQDDGSRVSEEINVFLPSNDTGLYKGKTAQIVMRLEDDASDMSCTTEQLVTLVDDDPCIHTGGEPICPDDTGESQ